MEDIKIGSTVTHVGFDLTINHPERVFIETVVLKATVIGRDDNLITIEYDFKSAQLVGYVYNILHIDSLKLQA